MSANPKKNVIRNALLTGLVVTFLLIFFKWCLEHTSLYEAYERATYSWLLSALDPPRKLGELPVVVLDIRELEYKIEEVDGEKFSVTPRAELLSLIEAVVSLKEKPKVVGVDIDFSPHKFGYGDLDDPKHFRKVLELREQYGVPIYLGINRSQDKKQSMWLGSPEFATLAANIDKPEDNRKSLEWTSGSGSESGEVAEHDKGPAMCQALARSFDTPERHLSSPLSWIVQRSSETRTKHNRAASEFLVDFSALNAIRDSRLKTIKPEVAKDQGRILAGKAVLIGDGTLYDARDTVIVPVAEEKDPIPGIYLHASAAFTLIKGPLYEFTAPGRFVADAVLALLVIIGVTGARLLAQAWRAELAEKRTTYFFTLVVTIIALLLAVLLLPRTRLIWSDFLFVLIALWIHPLAHEKLLRAGDWLKANVPWLLKKVFVEEKKEDADEGDKKEAA